jgi:hypothetical protein
LGAEAVPLLAWEVVDTRVNGPGVWRLAMKDPNIRGKRDAGEAHWEL